jgi:dimethylamine/trimethylamine dehydrogenase
LSTNGTPAGEIEGETVYTPDDVLAGAELDGPVVIYDFDHYYMGGCLAEMLRQQGSEVTIVTPASAVSAWTFMNNEMAEIRGRMIELGIGIELEQYLTGFENGRVHLSGIYRASDVRSIDCGSLIIVGARSGNDELFLELSSDAGRLAKAGIDSLRSIGDCRAPGAIAHAVYAGHECARSIDPADDGGAIEWERARLL